MASQFLTVHCNDWVCASMKHFSLSIHSLGASRALPWVQKRQGEGQVMGTALAS